MTDANDLGDVPRVNARDLDRAIDRRRGPFVVPGLAKGWPALERFTHAYVLAALRETDVGTGIGRALPSSLEGDVHFPGVTRRRPRPHIWLAPDGMTSPLHYDLPHNLNTVLRGEKEVVLYAPSESKYLYPASIFQTDLYPSNSQVDLARLDLGRFPRVAKAKRWTTTVRAGDTLYIPPRFWHFVRSRGESVAVNVWFDRGPWLLSSVARKPFRLWVYDALARVRGIRT